MDARFLKLKADAFGAYAQLVRDLADEKPVAESGIRMILFEAGASFDHLDQDVQTLKARRAASADLERAATMADEARALEANARESGARLQAVQDQAERMVSEAAAVCSADYDAARSASASAAKLSEDARQVLLRTADQAIDERIAEIQRNAAELESEAGRIRGPYATPEFIDKLKREIEHWETCIAAVNRGLHPDGFSVEATGAEIREACRVRLEKAQKNLSRFSELARQAEEVTRQSQAMADEIGQLAAAKLDPSRSRLSIRHPQVIDDSRATGGVAAAASVNSAASFMAETARETQGAGGSGNASTHSSYLA